MTDKELISELAKRGYRVQKVATDKIFIVRVPLYNGRYAWMVRQKRCGRNSSSFYNDNEKAEVAEVLIDSLKWEKIRQ